jgi:hypothetical protein
VCAADPSHLTNRQSWGTCERVRKETIQNKTTIMHCCARIEFDLLDFYRVIDRSLHEYRRCNKCDSKRISINGHRYELNIDLLVIPDNAVVDVVVQHTSIAYSTLLANWTVQKKNRNNSIVTTTPTRSGHRRTIRQSNSVIRTLQNNNIVRKHREKE